MARKDLRDTVEQLRLEFVEHKTNFKGYAERQEECSKAMQSDIKAFGVQIAEQNKHLCEYNAQLQVHIAGTEENREHIKIVQDNHDKFVKESDARLSALETPYKIMSWVSDAFKAFSNFAKRIGYIAGAILAAYGLWRAIVDHLILHQPWH